MALALQRMVEEDLYFCTLYLSWQRDDAFAVLSEAVFHELPAAMRPSFRAWRARAC
jgi:hypothetical protein